MQQLRKKGSGIFGLLSCATFKKIVTLAFVAPHGMFAAFDFSLFRSDDLVEGDFYSPAQVVPLEVWRTVFSIASPSSFSNLVQVCWLWKRAIYSLEFLAPQRERIEEDFNLLLLGPPSPSWIISPDALRLKAAWSDSISVHINVSKPTPKTQAFLHLLRKKAWKHSANNLLISCCHEGVYYQLEIEITSNQWQRGAINVFLVEETEELVENVSFNEIVFRHFGKSHPELCDSPCKGRAFDSCVLELTSGPGTFTTGDLQLDSTRCSFDTTRGAYTHQAWFVCHTCWPDSSSDLGCCAPCAKTCHYGHDLEFRFPDATVYCDCGNGSAPNPCTLRRRQRGQNANPDEQEPQPDPIQSEIIPLAPSDPFDLAQDTEDGEPRFQLEKPNPSSELKLRELYLHGQNMPLLRFPSSGVFCDPQETSCNLHAFFDYLLSRQYLLQGKISPALKVSYLQRLTERQSGWSAAAWQVLEALIGGILLCPILVAWWTLCSWYQILAGQLPLFQKPLVFVVVPTVLLLLLLPSAPFVSYNHVHDYGFVEALRNIMLRFPEEVVRFYRADLGILI